MKKKNFLLLMLTSIAIIVILIISVVFLYKYYGPATPSKISEQQKSEPPQPEETNKTAINNVSESEVKPEYPKECLKAIEGLSLDITKPYLCRSAVFGVGKNLVIVKNGRDFVIYSYEISKDSLFYLTTLKDFRFNQIQDIKVVQTASGDVVGVQYGFGDAGAGFWELKYLNTIGNNLDISIRADFNMVENFFSINYNSNSYKIEPILSSSICDQRSDESVEGSINDFKMNGVPLKILETPIAVKDLCIATQVKEAYISFDENREPNNATVYFYNDVFMLRVDLTPLKNNESPKVKFEPYQ